VSSGAKMSKSRGNIIEPGDVLERFGADTLRGTMLFAGPIEEDIDWADVSAAGMHKWLTRLLRLVADHTADPVEAGDTTALRTETHRKIAAVTADFDGYKYNTALAKLMELSNSVRATLQAGGRGPVIAEALSAVATMLSPICPHVAEELWHRLGHEGLVAATSWPTYDEALLVEATKRIVVQVDGRLRDTVVVPAGTAQDDVEAQGRSLHNVQRHLDGRDVVKVVWVPDRLLNFVTRS